MTPEEKAKELFNHYYNLIQRIGGYLEQEILVSILAKQCALIAVDEILNINSVDKDFSLSHYWLDVKDEIENL
jgi:hypothetical protein